MLIDGYVGGEDREFRKYLSGRFKMWKIKFLGSGDALGSGGRMQACLHVAGAPGQFLIDCGATVLVAMKRFNIDPSLIEMIIISHLHGDHFAGIPFFILDAQFRNRSQPLIVAGPPGLEGRVKAAMEILFPGSSKIKQKFAIDFVKLVKEKENSLKWIKVIPFEVTHVSGAPAYALRIEGQGKVIAYSGDTEWVNNLEKVGQNADIFIMEAYFFEKKIKYHLSYQTLLEKCKHLKCPLIILTHLHEDILKRTKELELEWAED